MTPSDPPLHVASTVLLIDDIESQAARIRECLRPYGVSVEWCPSYRAAVGLLADPDCGQLFDLVLIDQAFDVGAVPATDLLTHFEVGPPAGAEDWDVHLHQGLFILARLGQDMHEGLIPFTPMMILTHYARLEIAAQAPWPGGYQSKRRLLADPYSALKGYLGQLRPTDADVDRRLRPLLVALGIHGDLAVQVRRRILDGLDPDEACAALGRLSDPNDWRVVGRALDRIADEPGGSSADRLAARVVGTWLASPEGWLRVCHVEALGSLDDRFEVFRLRIGRPGDTQPALLAARAMPAGAVPGAGVLRDSFALLRRIDERSRPLRLRDGSTTVLGCWLPEREPVRTAEGAGAAMSRLAGVTRHVGDLHRRGLAHGSLTVLSAGFERPVFGGIRCLAGPQDLDALRRDDLRRLPLLAEAAFGEQAPASLRAALQGWLAAVGAGDLDTAHRGLAGVGLEGEPPAYFDFDRLYSGGEVGFRDRLLASLGSDDAVLREVGCGEGTPAPLDFVVCVGGTVAVLEHRARLRRVLLDRDGIACLEADSAEPEDDRCRRALARCRRCADALGARVEDAMRLPRGSIHRLGAIVVGDGTAVDPPGGAGWRPVMTAAAAVAELTRLSRAGGGPRGVEMADCLPRPDRGPEKAEDQYRALYWKVAALEAGSTRMRTWRKQWPPGSWRPLLGRVAGAWQRLATSETCRRSLPVAALRAYDDDGAPRDVETEPGSVELVEYELRTPAGAAPLSTYCGDDAGRRRLAAAVLRNLLLWERSRLAYRAMRPDGVVHADGRVYCDLLHSVVPADPEERRRQRRGAAACLVFLTSPWPDAWPGVLSGTVPARHEPADERSAWGIAATAVAALLDPEAAAGDLTAVVEEKARLLEAAADLDRRFPPWPAGLAGEAAGRW